MAHKKFLFLLLFPGICGCLYPHRPFAKKKVPAAPDYSQEKCWAALPTKKDSGDAVPIGSGLKDGQADAKVDVFFVYPTIYVVGHHWNADVYNEKLNKHIQKGTIAHQAAVFNGCARVYAPYYRQAVLSAYWDKLGAPAFDTAYADVKRAFQYYLDHYNQGRPIIIASHSQGSDHAARLLRDFFENDPQMREKLVAAYLIGRPFPKAPFKNIPTCSSPEQTGCFITWNTAIWGTTKLFGKKTEQVECVNPLSWKQDTVAVPPSANPGSIPYNFKGIDKQVTGAKVSPLGILWIKRPVGKGYLKGSNYHVEDYDLFYISIRENAALRVKTYLQLHPH